MSKAREFYIAFNKFNDGTYDCYGMSELSFQYNPPAELIKVKEVLPDEVSDSMMLEWLAKNERVLRKVGVNEYRIAHTEAELKFNTPREAILAAMQKEGK